jgi:hypothetical protein
MFSTFRTTVITAAALALAAGFAAPAEATFIFTMEEVGSDVVVNGSGSINTTGLTLTTIAHPDLPGLAADVADVVDGPLTGAAAKAISSFSGPTNFGPGVVPPSILAPTTSTGDLVGIEVATGHVIVIPVSYVSGANLSDTMTFTGETFANLGVIPGTYTWNFGTGANADSLILEIGAVSAVPEPASLTLLLVGLAGLAMVVRLRRG